MTDDPTGDGPDEEGLAGYWEAHTATGEVLREARKAKAFDYAQVTGTPPDGDQIDPGVEVLVAKGPYVAEIIRHRDCLPGGFNYDGKLPSRILHISISRRKGKTSEWNDLGTYDSDCPETDSEFMTRAEREPALRKFLSDISSYLS